MSISSSREAPLTLTANTNLHLETCHFFNKNTESKVLCQSLSKMFPKHGLSVRLLVEHPF